MQILALKLILTPLLTGLATWAGRKYGHGVSGLLIGLPLNAGPIALFLVLQHGPDFGAESAKGIILGAVSLALFATVYAALSEKLHWLLCIIAGWAAYLAATFFLQQFNFTLLATFIYTIGALLLVLIFFTKYHEETLTVIPPKWDIPLRIILATLFILGLTYISANLGARLSGLLTTFPIFGTIFASTTHALYGANACKRLMKSVIISLFSFCVFFLVIALYIQTLGILLTFAVATALCLGFQVIVLFLRKRYQGFKSLQAESSR